jgi:hypothetical protein
VAQPIHVDIPGLARVGFAVTHSADAFDQVHSGHPSRLSTGAPPEWGSTGAVTNASQAWQAFLRQLSGQVRDLGAALNSAARDLDAADAASAERTAGIPEGHPALGRAHGFAP